MLNLDHFVCSVIGLEKWSADFSHRSGVTPEFSGRHPMFGTHNALVSLDSGMYFELFAEDPNPPVPRKIELPHFKGLKDPQITCWYLRCNDFQLAEKSLSKFSLKTSPVVKGSRIDQNGNLLQFEWVDILDLDSLGFAAPSFIKWLPGVTHPTVTSPKGCMFKKLSVTHKPHKDFSDWLESLQLGIVHQEGEVTKVEVEIDTPKGSLIF